MKRDRGECYNKIFNQIDSIETKIKNIKENLSALKKIFNSENTKEKTCIERLTADNSRERNK
jgi:regulator of replication initiation timing